MMGALLIFRQCDENEVCFVKDLTKNRESPRIALT